MELKLDIIVAEEGRTKSYSYPIDMTGVKVIKYAHDNSFVIVEGPAALLSDSAVTLAVESDYCLAMSDSDIRAEQDNLNQLCEEHITEKLGWTLARQTSIFGGIYPESLMSSMEDAVATSIVECQRCKALVETRECYNVNWPTGPTYAEAKING